MIKKWNEFNEVFNYRYKLQSKTIENLKIGLRWFTSNFDITSGFVVPIDSNGLIIKNIDNINIIKTPQGYETEIGISNYDGELMNCNGEWNLDFIHKYMDKDNIQCNIEEFGTSGEKPPSSIYAQPFHLKFNYD